MAPVVRAALSLLEFPADDPERARRFWSGLLGASLEDRVPGQGEGWQTPEANPAVGVHERGRGPGDSFSLPYFEVGNVEEAGTAMRELKANGFGYHIANTNDPYIVQYVMQFQPRTQPAAARPVQGNLTSRVR